MSDAQQQFRGYQPYESETDTSDSETESEAESETSGTSDDERIVHDSRMEAIDSWRSAAQSWIARPAQPLLRPLPLNVAVPPPGPRPIGAPRAATVDLPLELRANDIKRHIINIDSQFRENPLSSNAGDFWWHMVAPMRNVLRVRVASVELPNNYKFFTKGRKYTTITIIKGALAYDLTIPDGNYTAGDMVDELLTRIGTYGMDLSGMTVDFSEITGKFTLTAPFAFSLDTVTGSHTRPFNYGLGWFTGFSYGIHAATDTSGGAPYVLISDGCADFAGDNYLLLKMNDFECVTHTVNVYPEGLPAQENAITALAKLVLREPKNYMTFDDNAGQHTKEVVFNTPRDLLRFHVQLLDDFGEAIDMCTAQFSVSLEVMEVRNPSLFDAVRESLMLRYV